MAGVPQPCIRALISHIVDGGEQGKYSNYFSISLVLAFLGLHANVDNVYVLLIKTYILLFHFPRFIIFHHSFDRKSL